MHYTCDGYIISSSCIHTHTRALYKSIRYRPFRRPPRAAPVPLSHAARARAATSSTSTTLLNVSPAARSLYFQLSLARTSRRRRRSLTKPRPLSPPRRRPKVTRRARSPRGNRPFRSVAAVRFRVVRPSAGTPRRFHGGKQIIKRRSNLLFERLNRRGR